jgi:hypothetical protein
MCCTKSEGTGERVEVLAPSTTVGCGEGTLAVGLGDTDCEEGWVEREWPLSLEIDNGGNGESRGEIGRVGDIALKASKEFPRLLLVNGL